MQIDDPKLITVDEFKAAEILGFTVKTMRKRRWERKPPTYLKVGRLIRYRLADLQEFLDSCRMTPR